MDLSPEKHERLLKKVKYAQDMLFLEMLVGGRIRGTELSINRTPHPLEIHANSGDDLIRKRKMRVWERGFDTQYVPGEFKESLYRALNLGLTDKQDDYLNIYLLGVM
ncbi:hypothetical protein Tco_1358127 [Tanacetum coccineum]